MNLVEQALIAGEYCHIRLNDGQVINDVYYLEDTTSAGKRLHQFTNGLQEHMVNPSYIAQITKRIVKKKVNNDEV